MALPQFTHAVAGTFIFERGPAYSDDDAPQPRQTETRSEAGQSRIVTYGGEDEVFPLVFPLLSASNAAGLLAWWRHASILWSSRKFTYTDSDSVARTVRLVVGSYKRVRTAGGYTVSFVLRNEPF